MGTGLQEVGRRIEAIRRDRQHGATYLARYALETLALAAEAIPPQHDLPQQLSSIGQQLILARPAMAAIKNVVVCFLREASVATVDAAATKALSRKLLERMEQASETVATNGAELVPDTATVLTCSYSSAVVRACKRSRELDKDIRVLAMESSWRGLAHGKKTAQELSAVDVPAEMVSDAQLLTAVDRCDLVLVGADKVLPNGSLVNGVPTLAVARAAAGRVPVYAVCESFKFDDDPKTEEGFDHVPGELVTGFVMETGLITPQQLRAGTRVVFRL